jgi:hypothetical protein
MTTVLEKPLAVETAEEILYRPKWRQSLLDKPRDMAYGLLDKAADSPTFHMATALGMMACWAYNTQANGYTKEMPSLLQHTVESGAHPVLGFVGASLGYIAAKSFIKLGERQEWDWVNKKSGCIAAIGVLAAIGIAAGDFAGEMGQGIVTQTYFDFAYQKYESTKDAIAATIGGVALGASNWREKRKATKSLS